MCLAFVFKISSTDSEIIAAYHLFWKLFITRTVISPRFNGTSFLDKCTKIFILRPLFLSMRGL